MRVCELFPLAFNRRLPFCCAGGKKSSIMPFGQAFYYTAIPPKLRAPIILFRLRTIMPFRVHRLLYHLPADQTPIKRRSIADYIPTIQYPPPINRRLHPYYTAPTADQTPINAFGELIQARFIVEIVINGQMIDYLPPIVIGQPGGIKESLCDFC